MSLSASSMPDLDMAGGGPDDEQEEPCIRKKKKNDAEHEKVVCSCSPDSFMAVFELWLCISSVSIVEISENHALKWLQPVQNMGRCPIFWMGFWRGELT
jgi:hypothetical protein